MQIYALIRTRDRRDMFIRCLISLNKSTIPITPIVAYDSEERPDYIPQGVMAFKVVAEKRSGYFYNLFCNALLDQLEGMPPGYFFFLDDDDYIYESNGLKRILPLLTEERGLIVQMARATSVKPPSYMIRGRKIESGKIGLPCMILHTKHWNLARFSDDGNADYKWIREINSKIKCNFAEKVLVMSPNRSYGR